MQCSNPDTSLWDGYFPSCEIIIWACVQQIHCHHFTDSSSSHRFAISLTPAHWFADGGRLSIRCVGKALLRRTSFPRRISVRRRTFCPLKNFRPVKEGLRRTEVFQEQKVLHGTKILRGTECLKSFLRDRNSSWDSLFLTPDAKPATISKLWAGVKWWQCKCYMYTCSNDNLTGHEDLLSNEW